MDGTKAKDECGWWVMGVCVGLGKLFYGDILSSLALWCSMTKQEDLDRKTPFILTGKE